MPEEYAYSSGVSILPQEPQSLKGGKPALLYAAHIEFCLHALTLARHLSFALDSSLGQNKVEFHRAPIVIRFQCDLVPVDLPLCNGELPFFVRTDGSRNVGTALFQHQES